MYRCIIVNLYKCTGVHNNKCTTILTYQENKYKSMQFTETIICCIPIHPFLKQGASLGVCDRWNGKCYAQFDGRAGRVKQVGIKSAQVFCRKGSVL